MAVLSNHLVDQFDRIQDLETGYDVFRYFKELATMFGFNRFLILKISGDMENFADFSAINNWDPELIQIYDEEGLTENSPILNHCQREGHPLEFNMESLPQDRAEEKKVLSVSLFNDFAMEKGISYPVTGRNGELGGVSFSGDKLAIRREDVLSLHLLSQYAYRQLRNTKEDNAVPQPQLSDRERDCLSWTAAGKTAAEIATILELSNHTVTHYLTSACKKLDATNRVQAVAKAIRLGILA